MELNWTIKDWSELSKEEFYEYASKRVEVFVIEQDCAYQDMDFRDQESYHIAGRTKDGEVVAYARIVKAGIAYDEVSIGRVLVTEKGRGHGLGIELMKRSMDFVKSTLKEDTIRISAQEYLLKFYQDLGFVSTGKKYLEDEIPHVEMTFQFDN